ncbi:MAG TPA: hypothetical protein VFF65_10085 [Phycisphaerales bacterium]|nr:hypothetical protein [Phycisphaerales bacterium]
MLIGLVTAIVLGQPAAPPANPPALPAPSQTEAAPATLADPPALEGLAFASISDRTVGQGIGAYISAQRMLDWAAAANPGDADAVARTRARWEAEARPGYEALIGHMVTRHGLSAEAVRERFEAELRDALATAKAGFTAEQLHQIVTENRLEVREQPAATASLLYMFDPAKSGDDGELIAAGKTRTVKARLNDTGGQGSVLELTVPLSWRTVSDKPGALTLAENAGLGPVAVTVNVAPIGPAAPRDPLKVVALMTARGEEQTEPVAVTLAGKPAGRATTVIYSKKGDRRLRSLYAFTVAVDGERAIVVGVSVGAPVKATERDYTTAELAAYMQSRKGVIDAVVGSGRLADAAVTAPAPAAGQPTSPAR